MKINITEVRPTDLSVPLCLILTHLIIFHTHIITGRKKKNPILQDFLFCEPSSSCEAKDYCAEWTQPVTTRCLGFVINKQQNSDTFFAHVYLKSSHHWYGCAGWRQLMLPHSRAAALPLCFNTHNAVWLRESGCAGCDTYRDAETD